MSHLNHTLRATYVYDPVNKGSGRISLRRLRALWRSRRALSGLDSRQLEDIGITAHDAAREARRAPWDVPAHWQD